MDDCWLKSPVKASNWISLEMAVPGHENQLQVSSLNRWTTRSALWPCGKHQGHFVEMEIVCYKLLLHLRLMELVKNSSSPNMRFPRGKHYQTNLSLLLLPFHRIKIYSSRQLSKWDVTLSSEPLDMEDSGIFVHEGQGTKCVVRWANWYKGRFIQPTDVNVASGTCRRRWRIDFI